MLFSNYPLSDQDQQKLLNAGWTLYYDSADDKQVQRLDTEEGATSFTMDTKAAIKRHAENSGYLDKVFVYLKEEGVRKESREQLIKYGFKLVRRDESHGVVKYYRPDTPNRGGGWAILKRNLAHASAMRDYMTDLLADTKTIEL